MSALAGAAVACLLAACPQPVVGPPAKSAQAVDELEIQIVDATVGAGGHVVATFTLTRSGASLSLDEAVALRPTFTLAALSTNPVDGHAAWKSLLLTGSQTLAQLPPAGPGTPPAQILTNVKQPGSESTGTLAAAGGQFTYTFANALPAGFDPTETVRIGVYLGLAQGTPRTATTHDFVPAGGTPAPRDTVLDANCSRCHGFVRAHGGRRVGVRLCLTCHTWQNADPDSVDPAAMDGATAATDPNPLEFGRLVHRIHRGKNLPTLYQSSSTDPAPALGTGATLPLPFFPGRNAPLLGRKYAIVGFQSSESAFGEVISRTDNQQPARTVAAGVVFPRDLRDCDACHGGAPQEYEVLYAISRRTCSGCHPDVWFGASSISDPVHFAHAGGPQLDDAECTGCHLAATPTQPKVYAPIAEIHVSPPRSPRHARPTIEIVSVQNLVPGGAPTVVFTLQDGVGVLSPPNAPSPALDPAPTGSPVPRALERLRISLSGPTVPDYAGPPALPISSADAGNPDPLALVADPVTQRFTYTFASHLPATAQGTWVIAFEARRRLTTTHYDPVADAFRWPYTGETVTESPDNALAWVDTAVGTWPGGAPVPRRTVVAQEKCERCHFRFELHGGQRHQVAYCVVCHGSDRTDWAQRPKTAAGNVNLAATYDGIEERSIHFKVLVHRIHTGGRSGSAALELVDPFVIYGYGGSPNFFDEGIFPNDLRNCTLCHEGRTYAPESVPADAPRTVANENPTLRHAGTIAHVAGEPATLPIKAACMGCHATGFVQGHADRHTVDGVEQCAQCHSRGTTGVDVAHGLATADAGAASATYSSIAQTILVPRCASAACHGGNPPANFPRLDAEAAYDELVGRSSQQAGVNLVEPFAPESSYLVLKLRGEAGSVGGVATAMPLGDALLDPSDIAAVEAWISNGAPND